MTQFPNDLDNEKVNKFFKNFKMHEILNCKMIKHFPMEQCIICILYKRSPFLERSWISFPREHGFNYKHQDKRVTQHLHEQKPQGHQQKTRSISQQKCGHKYNIYQIQWRYIFCSFVMMSCSVSSLDVNADSAYIFYILVQRSLFISRWSILHKSTDFKWC